MDISYHRWNNFFNFSLRETFVHIDSGYDPIKHLGLNHHPLFT